MQLNVKVFHKYIVTGDIYALVHLSLEEDTAFVRYKVL